MKIIKNALKVYKNDIKKITTNIPALIIIGGLMIIPSLYAWFNIASLMDPYGNASNLPIAVYTKDEGATFEGQKINLGLELVDGLKDNKNLAWQYPKDYDELKEGVNSGDSYAAIVIPSDFSTKLINAQNTYKHLEIDYIVNEKINAIAPKMTEAGANGITEKINSTINEQLTNQLVEYSNKLKEEVNQKEGDYYSSINSLDQLISNFSTIDNSFNKYNNIAQNISVGIKTLDSFNKNLNSDINQLDFTNIYLKLDQISAVIEDQSLVNGLKTEIGKIEKYTKSFNIDIDTSDYENLNLKISDFIYNKWPTYKSLIINGDQDLKQAGEDYKQIEQYLNKDGGKAGEFMSNPVQLKTKKMYPVENYGSSSMPFYTALCLWVGSLLLASILSFKTTFKVRNIEVYFGKLLTFISIGCVQAIVVTLGDVKLLNLTILNPWYLLIFNLMISVCFMTIIFTLGFVLGNIGKGIGIILLVLSISGGGGNFPIEVSGEFFNAVHPYLPFTYAVRLLREALAGIYVPTVIEAILFLIKSSVLAIIFGVLGIKYLKEYFDLFDKKAKESGLIH